jgi:hypothetical protein
MFRGQILPHHQKIEVEAMVTQIKDNPVPTLVADGFLKVDGLYVYQMDHFGLCLIPRSFETEN